MFVQSQLEKPLSWKSPRKIFVCPMSDLFHETNLWSWIDEIFTVIMLENLIDWVLALTVLLTFEKLSESQRWISYPIPLPISQSKTHSKKV